MRIQRILKKSVGICSILSLILTSGCGQANSVETTPTPSATVVTDPEDILDAKEITYKGDTYKQRRKVSSYLFIGVDKTGEVEESEDIYSGGQGDVQMVLVIDDLNRTWRILQLNRDSIVEVPVLGLLGDVVGYEEEQLCLAHSYGDGLEQSCENNVNTVSTLLNDQPIDGYYAMNMGAISTLNDLVGGVTVTIESDFSEVDSTLVQGETITLNGTQAYNYVHSRWDVDDATNIARMARQRTYMSGFLEKLNEQSAEFAVKAYNTLSGYSVTNIDSGTVSKIFQKVQTYEMLDVLTIDGENVVEDEHWAYHLDENSLHKVILELYYEKS